MPEFLLITGVFVFAVACRTFRQPAIRKIGALGVMAASFLIGFFIGDGSVGLGVVAVATWFFLPWVDLLTRIRSMRLPLDKKLRHRHAPGPDTFPHLRAYTREVEGSGFERAGDSGWEWDDMRHFVRFFYEPESKVQASISLKQQQHIAFAYFSLTSRTEDGRTLTTWNYPFGYPMKPSPERAVNRVSKATSFGELFDTHQMFLAANGVDDSQLVSADPEELESILERELRDEVDHNLDRGLIKLSGNGTFRYSWRGLFYLWGQAVKDMIRLA